MARSKSRKSKKRAARRKSAPEPAIAWGGPASKGVSWLNWAIGLVAVVAILGGAFYWWQIMRTADRFEALAAEGQPALERVETLRNDGRTHLQLGQGHRYAEAFPTSGPHALVWTDAGVYREPQPPTMLVHALEHGNVVIYHENPGAAAMDQIEAWAALYSGQWDGVVVTPFSGLGEAVVLTAWRKKLELNPFEPAAAAAFIDAYRGRGPENPVR